MTDTSTTAAPAIATKREFARRIHAATGCPPTAMKSLDLSRHTIFRVDLEDRRTVIAKLARPGLSAEPEAHMLRHLAERSSLPVPRMLFSDAAMIVMEFIAAERGLTMTNRAQEDAAEHLARLHEVAAPRFGHERDTVLGPLRQPNPPSESWRGFFRDARLMYMAGLAVAAGRLPPGQMARIERLAARLDDWIDEPRRASLLHGDLRGGNILVHATGVAAFLDPAIYYGDAEMDLLTPFMYRGLSTWFLRHYWQVAPPRPGFALRSKIYSLYHMLRDVARNPEPIYLARIRQALDSIGV